MRLRLKNHVKAALGYSTQQDPDHCQESMVTAVESISYGGALIVLCRLRPCECKQLPLNLQATALVYQWEK